MIYHPPAPLTLHRSIAQCDQCGTEAVLLSDGIDAYAATLEVEEPLTKPIRDREKVSAGCKRWMGDESCGGLYIWDLTEVGSWISADEEVRSDFYYAEKLEVVS